MKKLLTGLSLSICVMDILRGKVELEDVEFLVAGTNVQNQEQWDYVLNSYSEGYWREDAVEGRRIANYLRDNGLFKNPRAEGMDCHAIYDGHWIDQNGEPVHP